MNRHSKRLLIVAGPNGSGKSSLVASAFLNLIEDKRVSSHPLKEKTPSYYQICIELQRVNGYLWILSSKHLSENRHSHRHGPSDPEDDPEQRPECDGHCHRTPTGGTFHRTAHCHSTVPRYLPGIDEHTHIRRDNRSTGVKGNKNKPFSKGCLDPPVRGREG